MNASPNQTSGINLPPPVAERAAAPGVGQEALSQSPEQGPPSAPEAAPRAAAPQPAAGQATQAAIPVPVPTQTIQQNGASPAAATATITDDDDDIEKVWVNKAKQIVERTRNDPYRQSEELTVVKADYMKQRYNKIIKVSK